MLVQKGKIFLGSDVKIISNDLILNNYRYNLNKEPIPPVPTYIDSYDLVSKTVLTGSTINNSINTLPLKVYSVNQISTSGVWLFTLAADLEAEDICICVPQGFVSDTTYTLNPAVISKYDIGTLITNFNQIRIEMRTIKNTGQTQQYLNLTNLKYCLLVYRKKTEVIIP